MNGSAQPPATAVHLVCGGDNALTPTSADDWLRLGESARYAVAGGIMLTHRPEDAQVILFVGSCWADNWDVRRHPLVRRFPERCFLYYSEDHIFPFLPGVYPSLAAGIDPLRRARSGAYSSVLHIAIPHLAFDEQAPWLFSFRGSFSTHRSRRGLQALVGSPRSCIEDISTHGGAAIQGSPHAPGAHRQAFINLLQASKFCLCPRGRSPSSWRLFEVLRAGRVPVIISDAWLPPEIDTPWEAFSICVPERKVQAIPGILRNREADAPAMAQRAREVYEQWFAMEMLFVRIIEQCLALQQRRRIPERLARYLALLPLLRPDLARRFLLPRLKRGLLSLA